MAESEPELLRRKSGASIWRTASGKDNKSQNLK